MSEILIENPMQLAEAMNLYLKKINLMHVSASDDLYQLSPAGVMFKVCADHNISPSDLTNNKISAHHVKLARMELSLILLRDYGWNNKRVANFIGQSQTQISRLVRVS